MITQGWKFASAANVNLVGLTWSNVGGVWQINAGVYASAIVSTTFTVYYYYQ